MAIASARSVAPPGPKIWGAVVVVVAVIIGGALLLARGGASTGEPGRLTEAVSPLPADLALPTLVDATAAWGFDNLRLEASANQMAGGVAVADFDRDGWLDIVFANGEVVIAFGASDGFARRRGIQLRDAAAVTTQDVDHDGWPDLLLAGRDGDIVVWGGDWVESDEAEPATTTLDASGTSAQLLAAELSGDDAIDIVRLGHGGQSAEPDLLWIGNANDPRSFAVTELPHPHRFSLAAELVDIDLDGLLDIWITRDVGWSAGGDSLLSRRGDPTGEWHDVAAEYGLDLEVDAMGLTVADLDGDIRLDAYVSDLGDNEQLRRLDDGTFVPVSDTGAARIRPAGAAADIVSSSWASGAADINLDGVIDLVVVGGGFPAGGVRNKIPDSTVAVEEAPAVMLGVGGGQFVDVWPGLGIDYEAAARGMTIADLDRDGDDDFVVIARDGTVRAFRNDTVGASLAVSAAPACDAAGVVVMIMSDNGLRFQRLLAPHSYAGAHGAAVIVGTGADDRVSVRMRWADGTITNDPVDLLPRSRTEIVLGC